MATDPTLNAALARQLRERSSDALEQLLRTHGHSVHAVAYSIVGDFHAAEDITAETMIIAWQRIGSLRDDTKMRAWLFTIATRRALDHLRKRRLPLFVSRPHETDNLLEASAVARLTLRSAMGQLPDRMRAAVTLRYLADLSIDEVAEAMGRSRNTVKTELRNGLVRLRKLLADVDFEDDEHA